MEIIYITDSTFLTEETIATIGFFDGVHKGHRYLLAQLNEWGKKENLKTAIITFPVHPRKVLHKDYQPQLLNTFEEKTLKLSSTGIDYCYVLDFTQTLSEMTAYEFMCCVIKKKLKIKELIIGYDHKFGKERINNYDDYVEFGKSCQIQVRLADKYNKNNQHISSTVIRNLLLEGKVKEAASILSYNYFIQGEVISGNKIGRTIGVPTANINLNAEEKIIPKKGVYAVHVLLKNHRYLGMAYIGYRPTVTSQGEKRIEVNIFNFNRDIYGQNIKIEFIEYVRDDIHFENINQLKKQLNEDKKKTLFILNS